MLPHGVAGYSGSARRILHFGPAGGRHKTDSERDDNPDRDPDRGHIDEMRGDGQTYDDDDEADDVRSE